MSDLAKILLTSFLTVFGTVFGGTFVFVIGQFILKLAIEPLQQLRAVIANMPLVVMVNADVFSNSEKYTESEIKAAKEAYKLFAYELEAKLSTVIGKPVFVKLKLLPPKKFILKARNLILQMVIVNKETNSEMLKENIFKIKLHLGLADEFLIAEMIESRLNNNPELTKRRQAYSVEVTDTDKNKKDVA